METVTKLQQELATKNEEIKALHDRIKLLDHGERLPPVTTDISKSNAPISDSLEKEEIERYGRQMILPEIGLAGQLKLRNTSVLIVGCGGLGCPCAIYLAAAGIGHLGLVDYDDVELGNLHRQILHTESRVGKHKSASVASSCTELNTKISCTPYHLALNSSNALELIENYDIVVDATDNVATRYLLNDACVLAKKPLVSGSALRFEGQLTVYNSDGGPCYRCLYPTPPPPETVTNCSDGGVLGAVPGVIGCLQAIEVVKLASGMSKTFSQRLLLFDALYGSFKVIKLRPKQSKCQVCSETPTITKLIDYEQFCGSNATDKDQSTTLLPEQDRISVQEYQEYVENKIPHVLLDVRPEVHFGICSLANTTNIPMDSLSNKECFHQLVSKVEEVKSKNVLPTVPVFVICRRGNDSQMATIELKQKLAEYSVEVRDIKGGLRAWSKQVDSTFPDY